ncbi:unnamed protein product [Lactuca saligna]|uniref:Uncharacterized protein n=1 Tax=Lactuca saligna TaxID=75948 RepID=A0AA36A1T9_LACSI|nr:unnamed protein product [Lactuca saligna]
MSLLQLIKAVEVLSQKFFRSSSSLSQVLQDFIMSKVLYVFSHDDNVVKGPHAPDTPIVIQANNVAFSNMIPNQYKNSRIEDMTTMSKYILFVMHFVIFQIRCILRKCPLFESLYDFLNQKTTQKLFLYKNVGLQCQPWSLHTTSNSHIKDYQCGPIDGDIHLTRCVEYWVANPYVVESYYFNKEDDEGDEDDDAVDKEEDVDHEDDESEVDTKTSNIDMEEASTQGMTNSPPRLNHHIHFSSTFTSSITPYAEAITPH